MVFGRMIVKPNPKINPNRLFRQEESRRQMCPGSPVVARGKIRDIRDMSEIRKEQAPATPPTKLPPQIEILSLT